MADAVLKCVHKGCGKTFTEKDNESANCTYHPGPPVFHEGQKGWQCCKPRVLTFDEFLSIPACTTGAHSAVDDSPGQSAAEQEAAKQARAAAAEKVLAENQKKRLPMAEPAAAAATVAVAAAPAEDGKPEEENESDTDGEDTVVQPGQACRRRACGARFGGPAPTAKADRMAAPTAKADRMAAGAGAEAEQCVFHPGAPVFHEGSKGWSCCKRRVLEFDEFVKIAGCTTRPRHMFVGSGKQAGGGSSGAGPKTEPDVLAAVRHDFYQTGTSVTASFYLKHVDADSSTVLFHAPPAAPSLPATSAELHLDLRTAAKGGQPARHVCGTVPLFGPIVPARSSVQIRQTKVEVVLAKDLSGGEVALGWPALVAGAASNGQIFQVGSAARS